MRGPATLGPDAPCCLTVFSQPSDSYLDNPSNTPLAQQSEPNGLLVLPTELLTGIMKDLPWQSILHIRKVRPS